MKSGAALWWITKWDVIRVYSLSFFFPAIKTGRVFLIHRFVAGEHSTALKSGMFMGNYSLHLSTLIVIIMEEFQKGHAARWTKNTGHKEQEKFHRSLQGKFKAARLTHGVSSRHM